MTSMHAPQRGSTAEGHGNGHRPAGNGSGPAAAKTPVGELVNEVVGDVQRLVRQEVELAKAEIREEGGKAAKAGGMFGAAAFAGYMVLMLVSLFAVFGLAELMNAYHWPALIVTGAWALIGVVAFLIGRAQARSMSPMPQRTIETLKEDAQWARHPTGSGQTSKRPGPSSPRT